ncbi:hypothetical protein [Mesorhizobium sp.]|uniref:hypothetical protein n=1 Tax=Mesorhizobium sp. TaxID=1871066 RepID=UPI0025F23F71|nr:hypothetical protein [Mesorhizobium sp.]
MALPAADPGRSTPVLPSPDIKATRDFYRDQLGFGLVGPEMDDYLIVRRNEMEIHFWKSDDRVKLPRRHNVPFLRPCRTIVAAPKPGA